MLCLVPFRSNEEKQSAIFYQIIVVGAATKRLSSELRTANPHIPWKAIAGMRDILVHQYDRVNFNTLWDVVQQDIIELVLKQAAIYTEAEVDNL